MHLVLERCRINNLLDAYFDAVGVNVLLKVDAAVSKVKNGP